MSHRVDDRLTSMHRKVREARRLRDDAVYVVRLYKKLYSGIWEAVSRSADLADSDKRVVQDIMSSTLTDMLVGDMHDKVVDAIADGVAQ